VIFQDFPSNHDLETLSIDFNASLYDDSADHSLSLDFLPDGSYPKIRGSYRGFLLLDCNPCLYLWNPSTGVNKEILVFNSYNNYFKLLFGFGYDLSSDDYIVLLGSYKYNYSNTNSINLEIFSLKANKWKQVKVVSDFPYRSAKSSEFCFKVRSFLNRSIHWLVYNFVTGKDVIIAFDLKEATMPEIALPNDCSPGNYDLFVSGGLISVWTVEMSTLKIWVMQEYAMHSSWTKTLDFSFHPALDFSPVCFTNCGDIVGPSDDGGLVKLNDKGQLLEYHSYGDRYVTRSKMAVYTESLFSLPDGTEQA